MKLEFYSEEKLKKQVLEILRKNLDLLEYKVFFFGSRVTGNNSERSDIDIGIEGVKPVSAIAMAKIREAINALPFLYSVDVVDFKEVGANFSKIAKQKIELVND